MKFLSSIFTFAAAVVGVANAAKSKSGKSSKMESSRIDLPDYECSDCDDVWDLRPGGGCIDQVSGNQVSFPRDCKARFDAGNDFGYCPLRDLSGPDCFTFEAACQCYFSKKRCNDEFPVAALNREWVFIGQFTGFLSVNEGPIGNALAAGYTMEDVTDTCAIGTFLLPFFGNGDGNGGVDNRKCWTDEMSDCACAFEFEFGYEAFLLSCPLVSDEFIL